MLPVLEWSFSRRNKEHRRGCFNYLTESNSRQEKLGNANSMVRKSARQLAQRLQQNTGRTSQAVLNGIILASNPELMLRHILALMQGKKGYVYSFSVCNRSLVRSTMTLLTTDSGIQFWSKKKTQQKIERYMSLLLLPGLLLWAPARPHHPEDMFSCYKSKLTILDSNLGSVRFCTLLANCYPDF